MRRRTSSAPSRSSRSSSEAARNELVSATPRRNISARQTHLWVIPDRKKLAATEANAWRSLDEAVTAQPMSPRSSRVDRCSRRQNAGGERDKLLKMEERSQPASSARRGGEGRSRPRCGGRGRAAGPHRRSALSCSLGPTGVGKDRAPQGACRVSFDDEAALVRIDMSNYGETFGRRLDWSPPGYVGYEKAALLMSGGRRPYQVVSSTRRKAHPDVFNVLLQVLGDRRLTDGQAARFDFRQCSDCHDLQSWCRFFVLQKEGGIPPPCTGVMQSCGAFPAGNSSSCRRNHMSIGCAAKIWVRSSDIQFARLAKLLEGPQITSSCILRRGNGLPAGL